MEKVVVDQYNNYCKQKDCLHAVYVGYFPDVPMECKNKRPKLSASKVGGREFAIFCESFEKKEGEK